MEHLQTRRFKQNAAKNGVLHFKVRSITCFDQFTVWAERHFITHQEREKYFTCVP